MQNQLNEFLEKNGVGTHAKTKRVIAKALGMADFTGNELDNAILLNKLTIAEVVDHRNTLLSYRVEVAFDKADPTQHMTITEANNKVKTLQEAGMSARVVRLISIEKEL